jgi:outer membrane protein TolC
VAAQLLDFVRSATQAYWVWVAAGQSLAAQRQLLELAEGRVKQIEARVESGDLERITRINNNQLIASRETKAIEAQRKLQEAAIKLSLFLRDDLGRPRLALPLQLPASFPEHEPPEAEQVQQDIANALAARPELVELDLLARQVQVELAQAQNMLRPKLDATVLASKDVGEWADEKGDKTPFELEAGLLGEIPLQRREARGKVEAARGKLAQIRAKRRFTVDKITAEVRDTVSALQAAAARIERAQTNLELSRQTLELGRQSFNAGDIDLIALNIYEQAVTDAQLLLISAQVDFFVAEADYRAALAREYDSSI